MPILEKQLGQVRMATGGTAEQVYTPPAGKRAIVRSIVITNTSGSKADVRLYNDADGSVRDETTAILWDEEIPRDETLPLQTYLVIDDGGEIAAESDIDAALTVTVYGAEITDVPL